MGARRAALFALDQRHLQARTATGTSLSWLSRGGLSHSVRGQTRDRIYHDAVFGAAILLRVHDVRQGNRRWCSAVCRTETVTSWTAVPCAVLR